MRLRIYEILRPLIKDIPKVQKRPGMSTSEILESEYDMLFSDSGKYKVKNDLYDIEIQNNIPDQVGLLRTYKSVCDFCDRSHSDNCFFSFPDDVTLEEILNMRKDKSRELALTISWKQGTKANIKTYENAEFRAVSLNNSGSDQLRRGNVSLYDCLTCFSQEETLGGSDMWYCKRCKDHVPALKKMEIYKTPQILIIHLKRFSHQRNSFFGSRKINL
jgi:ribosomal protein L37AE/L43A